MNKRGQMEVKTIIIGVIVLILVILGVYGIYSKVTNSAGQVDAVLTAAIGACNNAASLGDSGKAEFCRSRALTLPDGKTHFMNCDTGYLSAYVNKNNALKGQCAGVPLVTCQELQGNSEYAGETVVIGGTDGQSCTVARPTA